jgi:hypothetical protein
MRKASYMSMDVFNSVALLLVTAITSFLATRFLLKRLRAARTVWLTIGLLWIASIAGILVLDVNVPLAASQYTLEDAPAPVPLEILAMFLRFAALAAIVLAQPKLRSAFPR